MSGRRPVRHGSRSGATPGEGLGALATAALALLLAVPAGAAPNELIDRFDATLDGAREALRDEASEIPVAGWLARNLRLSGMWIGAGYDARARAPMADDAHFQSWDSRVFADLDLLEDVGLGERPIVDAVGIHFEWQIDRIGVRVQQVGEAVLDIQGLGGSSWVDVQIGRFHLPVGEAYRGYGPAAWDNPFISNPVGGTWWWDEGVRLSGMQREGRFGYVASWTSGENERNDALDGDGQGSLKLFVQPLPWLYLSASGLLTASTGRDDAPAMTSLWLGETLATPVGLFSPVPTLYDGAVAPRAPGRLQARYLGADAVLTHPRGLRLWLGYGNYEIDADGSTVHDRTLHGWVAELVVAGEALHPALRRGWLAARANGIGTYDADEGYLLDGRYAGSFGYNLRSFDAWSLAAGWRLGEHAKAQIEYSIRDLELVRGGSGLGLRDGRADSVGFGLGFRL